MMVIQRYAKVGLWTFRGLRLTKNCLRFTRLWCVVIVVVVASCFMLQGISSWVGKDDDSMINLDLIRLIPDFDVQVIASLSSGVLNVTTTKLRPSINVVIPEPKHFQPVNGTKMFVYSAYTDRDWVRVIGIVHKEEENQTLTCQLWYDVTGEDSLTEVRGRVKVIQEHHGQTYRANYIMCQLPAERWSHPLFGVSIATKKGDNSTGNLLRVQGHGRMTSNFTVCASTINSRFNNAHQVVEMIELNRILGADKFVFYNYSIGPDVDKVLMHYQRRGLVDVHTWNLPTEDVHYYGQLAALNDCLYRYRHRAWYMVNQDIDEFIIPRNLGDWTELLGSRKRVSGPKTSVFLVRSVYLRRDWPGAWKEFLPFADRIRKSKSVVLNTVTKETKVFPYNDRSKYIFDPRQVTTLGIHFAWNFVGKPDEIPDHEALLYHYRDKNSPEDPVKREEDVTVVRRYGEKLLNRLERAWARFEQDTGIRSEDLA